MGVLIYLRGVFCWGTANSPTLSDSYTTETPGTGIYTSNMNGLAQGRTYYVRAYATNIVGTTYGNQLSFTTVTTPTVSTNSVDNILISTVTCGGNITSDGGSNIIARGVCWSTNQNPLLTDSHTSDGTGIGSFASSIGGLTPGTTYYVRAYASNIAGTSYGYENHFTTQVPPVLSTGSITNIRGVAATGGGDITDDGGLSVISRGVCWSTVQGPIIAGSHSTDGSGTGLFTSSINDLLQDMTYYVKAYVINASGTFYGNELSFHTLRLPVLTTGLISGISASSATGGGDISDSGSTAVSSRGICWSTGQNPTLANDHTENGSGLGQFTSSLSGLLQGVTYFVRAFAINRTDTAYGAQASFITQGLPTVTTTSISNIGITSAESGGNVINDGGRNVTSRGICWSTLQNPSITDSYTSDGTGTGSFASMMNGLSQGTLYYCRAYATNNLGTAYGSQLSFTTVTTPTVTTNVVTNILGNTATGGGAINSDGGSPITAYGACWSNSPNPSISDAHTNDGAGTNSFTSNMTGLLQGVTYYVRAYAINIAGVSYGNQMSFITNVPPVITTSGVSNLAINAATCGGNVTSDGGTSIIARGVCWSTSHNPGLTDSHTSDGTGTGSFTSSLTGLTEGTTYYVRAYATSLVGTGFGTEISFTTRPCPSTLIDADGNTYNAVIIGTQCWMKENLKTTKFRNTTAIPNVTDATAWAALTSEAWCYYNNDTSNNSVYGKIYNWYSVNQSNGLCPLGWHVPSQTEFTTLTTYLGGTSVAGGKLKEAGTTHWNSPNTSATNSSGFTGLPGGWRPTGGSFGGIRGWNNLWCATEFDASNANYYTLSYNTSNFYGTYNYKYFGCAVRCIKGDYATVNTSTITNIRGVASKGGGSISNDGGADIIARGICWSTSQNPTISDTHTADGTGTGSFSSILPGLLPATTYYVRAYATNIIGTSYGNQVSFTTLSIPSLTTTDATNITVTTATTGGNITTDGGSAIVLRGVCWSTVQNPTLINTHTSDNNGLGSFTSNITGLIQGNCILCQGLCY